MLCFLYGPGEPGRYTASRHQLDNNKTSFAILKVLAATWSILTSLVIACGLLLDSFGIQKYPVLLEFQPNAVWFAIALVLCASGAAVIANVVPTNQTQVYVRSKIDVLFWGVPPVLIGLLVCGRYFQWI